MEGELKEDQELAILETVALEILLNLENVSENHALVGLHILSAHLIMHASKLEQFNTVKPALKTTCLIRPPDY